MVKYHIATGDGKAYYGVNYESYREAEAVLKFSQKRDPKAHIVEEQYHFTNADRIRAMSDDELADVVANGVGCVRKAPHCMEDDCTPCILGWLKQPAEEEAQQDCTNNKDGHCIGQKLMPECDPKSCDRKNH